MSKSSDNKQVSSKGRVILWTIVGLGVVSVLIWDQYAQGNLDPYLEMAGLKEPAASKSKSATSRSTTSSKTSSDKDVAESRPAESSTANPAASTDSALPTEASPELAVNSEETPAKTLDTSETNQNPETEPTESSPQEVSVTEPVVPDPVPEATEQPVVSEVEAEAESIAPPVAETSESETEIPAISVSEEKQEVASNDETAPTPENQNSNDVLTQEQSPLEALTNAPRVERSQSDEKSAAPIPPKLLSYAARIMKKYDLDRSTQLEAAEYERVTEQETLRQADLDGDQKITLPELARYMADYGENRRIRLISPYQSKSTTTTAASENTNAVNNQNPDSAAEQEKSDAEKELERRRNLQFSVKQSRLPDGLPGWF
ncbi:MAG: hypothetical protein R3C11_05770 [Planctomycetaceae bacterium]